MAEEKSRLHEIMRMPSGSDVLYRLPWSVGLVCSGYLLIGLSAAERAAHSSPRMWQEGAYWQSYFTASMLLYSLLLCIAAASFGVWKRRDIAGALLILVFLYVLLLFYCCFLHKTRGVVIWPMSV